MGLTTTLFCYEVLRVEKLCFSQKCSNYFLSFSNLSFGKPSTNYLLCHNHVSSSFMREHCTLFTTKEIWFWWRLSYGGYEKPPQINMIWDALTIYLKE